MLSLSPTDTGLPPHAHGASHLLLLGGSKRWALWPPAAGLPAAAILALPPPLLRSNSSALFAALSRLKRKNGRPLICDQRPGDVVYLPAGTHHATWNRGNATAVPVCLCNQCLAHLTICQTVCQTDRAAQNCASC